MSIRALVVVVAVSGCAARHNRTGTPPNTPRVTVGACANPLNDGVVTGDRDVRHRLLDLNDDEIPEILMRDHNACDDFGNCFWNLFSVDTSGNCMPYAYRGTFAGRAMDVAETTTNQFRDVRTAWFGGEDVWIVRRYRATAAGGYEQASEQVCIGPDPDDAVCSATADVTDVPRSYSLRPLVLPSGHVELDAMARTWSTDPPQGAGAELFVATSTVLAGRVGHPLGDVYGWIELPLGEEPGYAGDTVRASAVGARFRLTDYAAVRAEAGGGFLHRHRASARELTLAADMRVRSRGTVALLFSFGGTRQDLEFDPSVMDTTRRWMITRLFVDGDARFRIWGPVSGSLGLSISVPVATWPSRPGQDPATDVFLEEVPLFGATVGAVLAATAHIDILGRWQYWAEHTEQSYTLGVRARF